MSRTVFKAKATKCAIRAAPDRRAICARSSSPRADERHVRATVAEFIHATRWQAHLVRGAVLRRKYDLPITLSSKCADTRVFRLGA